MEFRFHTARGKSWLTLITLLITFFIVFPTVFLACDDSDSQVFVTMGCWGVFIGSDNACDPFLTLEVRIHSNQDGLIIPDSHVTLYNQFSSSWTYYSDREDGIIIVDFGGSNEAYNLVPCGDWCNDQQDVFYGHTMCLEDGATVDIRVEAWAEGHASQADTLTLDNQSSYEIMTFFLEPL